MRVTRVDPMWEWLIAMWMAPPGLLTILTWPTHEEPMSGGALSAWGALPDGVPIVRRARARVEW